MNLVQEAFYGLVQKNIKKFWKQFDDFKGSTFTVKDVSDKKFEVTNIPEKIEVFGTVQTDYKSPKDRFKDYRGLFQGLHDDLLQKIVEYQAVVPILESIRDKDNKPVVNLSNDFSEIIASLSAIDSKMQNLSEKTIEFEKLKGSDPKDYVPVRLTDGDKFYKAMAMLGGDSDPLAGYKISDIDDDNADYNYYGYLKYNGKWYIMKEDVVNKTYRYLSGGSNYANNFTNRAGLSYHYFNEISL